MQKNKKKIKIIICLIFQLVFNFQLIGQDFFTKQKASEYFDTLELNQTENKYENYRNMLISMTTKHYLSDLTYAKKFNKGTVYSELHLGYFMYNDYSRYLNKINLPSEMTFLKIDTIYNSNYFDEIVYIQRIVIHNGTSIYNSNKVMQFKINGGLFKQIDYDTIQLIYYNYKRIILVSRNQLENIEIVMSSKFIKTLYDNSKINNKQFKQLLKQYFEILKLRSINYNSINRKTTLSFYDYRKSIKLNKKNIKHELLKLINGSVFL